MTIRLALLAAASLLLVGCGRQGGLDRPAPLFGERARAQYEAEKAKRGTAPDETSREENEDEDRDRAIPDPNESLRPRTDPGRPR